MSLCKKLIRRHILVRSNKIRFPFLGAFGRKIRAGTSYSSLKQQRAEITAVQSIATPSDIIHIFQSKT